MTIKKIKKLDDLNEFSLNCAKKYDIKVKEIYKNYTDLIRSQLIPDAYENGVTHKGVASAAIITSELREQDGVKLIIKKGFLKADYAVIKCNEEKEVYEKLFLQYKAILDSISND